MLDSLISKFPRWLVLTLHILGALILILMIFLYLCSDKGWFI
jgi:hypothetical protein